MFEVRRSVETERAIIVGSYPVDAQLAPDRQLDELAGLVRAAGAEPVARVCQRRGLARARRTGGRAKVERPLHPATYIGRGKARQVGELAGQHEADVVVFDNELTPAQIRELEKIIGCRVIDRSELILDIFAERAKTATARLQVEMAQLQYTAPRLRGMWSHLERQAATGGTGSPGVGLRGPGEKQIEIDRRIVGARLKRLRDQLSKIHARREREVADRGREHFCVGLVGYTNAGKSTLMNALTSAETHVADALFATLDTKTRRWHLGPGMEVMLSDTVGFVRDLPHYLVDSFRSTLEEALNADLLLHVIDASHPQALHQIDVVERVLAELSDDPGRVLGVLNKVDLLDDDTRLAMLCARVGEATPVSARTGAGLEELTERVAAHCRRQWVRARIRAPASAGKLQAFARSRGHLLSDRFEDDRWVAEIELHRRTLARLRQLSDDAEIETL